MDIEHWRTFFERQRLLVSRAIHLFNNEHRQQSNLYKCDECNTNLNIHKRKMHACSKLGLKSKIESITMALKIVVEKNIQVVRRQNVIVTCGNALVLGYKDVVGECCATPAVNLGKLISCKTSTGLEAEHKRRKLSMKEPRLILTRLDDIPLFVNNRKYFVQLMSENSALKQIEGLAPNINWSSKKMLSKTRAAKRASSRIRVTRANKMSTRTQFKTNELIQPSCSYSKRRKIDTNQTKVSGKPVTKMKYVSKITCTNLPTIREMQQKIFKKLYKTPFDSSICNQEQSATEGNKINNSILTTNLTAPKQMNEKDLQNSKMASNTKIDSEQPTGGSNSQIPQKINQTDDKHPVQHSNINKKQLVVTTGQETKEVKASEQKAVFSNNKEEINMPVVKSCENDGENLKSLPNNKQMKVTVDIDSKQREVLPVTTAIDTSPNEQSNHNLQICQDNQAVESTSYEIALKSEPDDFDSLPIYDNKMEESSDSSSDQFDYYLLDTENPEAGLYKITESVIKTEDQLTTVEIKPDPDFPPISMKTENIVDSNTDSNSTCPDITVEKEVALKFTNDLIPKQILCMSEERRMQIMKQMSLCEVKGLLGYRIVSKIVFDEETSKFETVLNFEPVELVHIPKEFAEFATEDIVVGD